ncbi:hypothetical protein PLESTB_000653600 [Pleodorina starrii]|uniref:Integrase catalytic domain-containing protein n=1 Tax=Pleodorina starrii TaxID=330485 RepID=A0A9W6F1Y3_9CHLO|nr:hypothetical protein PLESTB_000653600 [Pleodorina starrii]GLC71659.1 hypothetical protein PLESTF_001146500 [Pleodorina starrii]
MTRFARGGVSTRVSTMGIRAAQRGVCEPCALGKQTQQPHRSTGHVAARRLDQVHMDVGVMPITSAGGNGYYATFYDDFTKFSEVRCIEHKSDVPLVVREVLTLWQTQTGDKVRRVHTDRGGEYVNKDLLSVFAKMGVLHEKTAPYSPQQNGAAERLNRTLMDRVRAMLIDSGQPQEMWGEAIRTANLLRNVTPTSDSALTPWERFTGQKPDLSRLRVFGSIAYVMVPSQKRKKLDPVAIKGVMVGYEWGLSAWRIWDPIAQKLHLSTDVVFNEQRRWGCDTQHYSDSDSDSSSYLGPEEEEEDESGPDTDPDADGDGPGADEEDESSGDGGGSAGEPEGADPPDSPPGGDPPGDANPPDAPEENVRRSARMNKGKMPARYVGTVASEVPVPTTADEAMASLYGEFWTEAMEEEMASHRAKGTFSLVQSPPGVRPLGSKWVFSLKQDENGVVERFKARWVVKGFMQREEIDFEEVFAPVSKQSTLRAFLSMVAAGNMELHQLDVKTAFLNGALEEEIYVTQPPGFEVGGPNVVARLHKALYGLRQASRTWYKTLHERLKAMGYEQSAADPSLYVRVEDGVQVYVLVYVDDVLVASVSHELVLQAKAELMRQFECRDMGEASVFLGMEIKRNRERNSLALSQKRMISELVSNYGMEGAQPKPVPMAQGTVLVKSGSEERLDRGRYPYSELVGSLLYIAGCTRPDISYAVGVLTRHMANPSMEHWKAAKGVVRYLAGTVDYGIVFGGERVSEGMVGFSDADHAGCLDSRRSTTGYVFTVHGGAVSWASKIQRSVAVSTMEAEYMAASEASKEALWLRQLLSDLKYEVRPTTINCDSQSAIKVIKNPVVSVKSKHIAIRYHSVREQVMFGSVVMVDCRTDEMVADILTKPLPTEKFEQHRASMGVCKI